MPQTLPVVLITGASTGIGAAIARRLKSEPYRLVLTARKSSLKRFSEDGWQEDGRTLIRELDVVNFQQANALVAEIQACWGGIDVLINNAGICYRAVAEHLDDQDQADQFQVNYFGPVHLIRALIPGMRHKRKGQIINISSVGGMMAMPTMGAYSASKFALEGMSEALWYELRPWGIHVTLIEPGFVHSNGFQNAIFTEASRRAFQNADCDYHHYYADLIPFITRMMGISPTTPSDIASKIARILRSKNPPLRVPGTFDALIFSLLRRILPSRLYHWFLYYSLPNVRKWVDKTQNRGSQDEKGREMD